MKYDFTSIMNRHGKDAIAVDSVGQMNGFAPEAPKPGFDVIPLWVADMNFPTVPTIQQAIIERAQHPAFGYFSATDEYYDSIIRWHQTRNGVTGLPKECIGYQLCCPRRCRAAARPYLHRLYRQCGKQRL